MLRQRRRHQPRLPAAAAQCRGQERHLPLAPAAISASASPFLNSSSGLRNTRDREVGPASKEDQLEAVARTCLASYGSVVLETPKEILALQRLLDASHAVSTPHLQSIVREGRVLSAQDVVTLLTGMKVIALATVTAAGHPRVSALDGHFLHGKWTFGTSGTSAKAKHMQRRPAVSIAHIDNEQLAVFSQGEVEQMREGDSDWAETLGHWESHYGSSPLSWSDDPRMYRYRPSWMVGYAADRQALIAGA